MIKLLLKSLFLALIIGICIFACKKDKIDTETQSAIDNTESAKTVFSVFAEVTSPERLELINMDTIGGKSAYVVKDASSCATITILPFTPSVGSATMEINYGTTGCLCDDGVERKGVISAVYTGRWDSIQVNNEISITLSNYYEDDIKKDGTITITYSDEDRYTLVASNITIHASKSYTWNANLSYNVVQQDDTATAEDDKIITITGSSNGCNRNGITYTSAITTALTKNVCEWFVSGVIELTPKDLPARVISYGDGTCDDRANLTVDGISVDFDME